MVESTSVLVFQVGGSRFGLPADSVREAFRAVTIAPLPKAPAVVEGVVNVRGQVVPVLDIRSRFRLPRKDPEHTDHFILAEVAGGPLALRVDRVMDLVRVPNTEIETGKTAMPLGDYVSGVAKLPDGLVLIHDFGTFLSREESLELGDSLSQSTRGPE